MRKVILVILAAVACTDSGQEVVEARFLSDVAENIDDVKRVLVYHDMEGLTGQSDPKTFQFRHSDQYAIGRIYLTGDVNAVVEGLFLGGADEVHIVDGHGSGNPDPDLLLDQLDQRAVLVSRDEIFDAYVDLVEPDLYDAVAVVGMHAKTGSKGFASHTFTLGIDFILNGMSVTETEVVGYSWGRVGVPVIFASGDDRLREDLLTPMPWVEFVTVKTATSAATADPRPVAEARKELTDRAKQAMENYQMAKVMQLGEPVVAELRAVPPADLSIMDGVPGIDYSDQKVRFEAEGFSEAYDGLVQLVEVARSGYPSVLAEIAGMMTDGEVNAAYRDALFKRWTDFESGLWEIPDAVDLRQQVTSYHGFR